ncbi:MAG: hypothetical protein AABZ00_16525 [Chloroflexota bacterium]
MNFLKNLFGKKQPAATSTSESSQPSIAPNNSELSYDAKVQIAREAKANTWWVIPGQVLSPPTKGFLVYKEDTEHGQTVPKIEGGKIIIVNPKHKNYLTNDGKIRTRVIYEASITASLDMPQEEFLDAIMNGVSNVVWDCARRLRESGTADSLIILECEEPKYLLMLTQSLTPSKK